MRRNFFLPGPFDDTLILSAINKYNKGHSMRTKHHNPLPNEHSARLMAPSTFYARFRRENNKLGKGVHVIWGVPKDIKNYTVEMQAIRFDAKKFTPEKAKLWLKKHGLARDVIKFEPAVKSNPCNPKEMYPGAKAATKLLPTTKANVQRLKKNDVVYNEDMSSALLIHNKVIRGGNYYFNVRDLTEGREATVTDKQIIDHYSYIEK